MLIALKGVLKVELTRKPKDKNESTSDLNLDRLNYRSNPERS